MIAALLLVAAAAGPVGAARETIGVWRGWGAFREPGRCFAIARPVAAAGRTGGFADVASWPARALRASFHAQLSRAPDPSTPVTLSVGERRFRLAARGRDVWTADGPGDRALVAALRSGRSMSIEGVGAGGRPFADVYVLAGAATAIDAATLACVAPGRR